MTSVAAVIASYQHHRATWRDWRHERRTDRDVRRHVARQCYRKWRSRRCQLNGALGRLQLRWRWVGSVVDGGDGPAGGRCQHGDDRRQPGCSVVVLPAELLAPVVELFHRIAGRQRPHYRSRVDAVLYGVSACRTALVAGRAVLWPVAVPRLHRLSLFHLHRLLHHHRPLLLRRSAGALPQVAHQAQGKRLRTVTNIRYKNGWVVRWNKTSVDLELASRSYS